MGHETGRSGAGVLSLEPIVGEHPIPLKNGMPSKDDHYNTSHNFHIKCMFPKKMEMNIVSHSEQGNGILFEEAKEIYSCLEVNSPAQLWMN